MDPDEFAKRTVNLEDGFDPLLPATHPHVGTWDARPVLGLPRLIHGQIKAVTLLSDESNAIWELKRTSYLREESASLSKHRNCAFLTRDVHPRPC